MTDKNSQRPEMVTSRIDVPTRSASGAALGATQLNL